MELGDALGRRLGESQHDEVLTRWLAQYLAETLTEVESAAEGPDRAAAEARACDLILRLWRERRILPDDVDPLGAYRRAIEVLSRLSPSANPWGGYSGPLENVFGDLYGTMGRLVVAGLALTTIPARPEPAEPGLEQAMSPEERALRATLDDWVAVLRKPERPRLKIKLVPASGAPAADETSPEADAAKPLSMESAFRGNLVRAIEDANRLLERFDAMQERAVELKP
ncbi:hypothetical protein [uncultured Brevundimonas sp.]|uniref:hypothetical protein n=1 Tax=uncultured Brevundimonas sp. TaxID=213418 RepID=UPI0025FE3590|nr:hypothetical protein [uncultured Brevundimonas sp.]